MLMKQQAVALALQAHSCCIIASIWELWKASMLMDGAYMCLSASANARGADRSPHVRALTRRTS